MMENPIRILITDDKPGTRRGLRAVLTFVPQVEIIAEAANGQEAMQLVAAHQPDVVLMDIRMPLMDGLEATRKIKQKWPAVRVIVLSMYSQYQTEALAAGADIFLTKGCPHATLQDAILSRTSRTKQLPVSSRT